MTVRFRLSEAMNTYDPALLVLKDKGYGLRLDPSEQADQPGCWVATKGQWQFMASDPLTLLGLVAVWEHRGESWQKRVGEEKIYNRLLKESVQP